MTADEGNHVLEIVPGRIARYRHVLGVLGRHGFGWFVASVGLSRRIPFHKGILRHKRRSQPYLQAEHLRMVLEDLGPGFVDFVFRSAATPIAESEAPATKLADAEKHMKHDSFRSDREPLLSGSDMSSTRSHATPIA